MALPSVRIRYWRYRSQRGFPPDSPRGFTVSPAPTIRFRHTRARARLTRGEHATTLRRRLLPCDRQTRAMGPAPHWTTSQARHQTARSGRAATPRTPPFRHADSAVNAQPDREPRRSGTPHTAGLQAPGGAATSRSATQPRTHGQTRAPPSQARGPPVKLAARPRISAGRAPTSRKRLKPRTPRFERTTRPRVPPSQARRRSSPKAPPGREPAGQATNRRTIHPAASRENPRARVTQPPPVPGGIPPCQSTRGD